MLGCTLLGSTVSAVADTAVGAQSETVAAAAVVRQRLRHVQPFEGHRGGHRSRRHPKLRQRKRTRGILTAAK